MYRTWEERGPFRSTEEWIAEQARTIRKNGWLAEMELEEIKRSVLNEDNVIDGGEQPEEVDNEDAQRQDDNESSSKIDGKAQPNNGESSEPENTWKNNPDLFEEELEILCRIKEIMVEGSLKL